eukprot:TRINITY_DN3490_c0_g1_i3.p1 TRINITY_DN3490_c0_g1~~TRINITY_DN3490_c0_g1_i3.p1  ORF type:complete len:1203 (+),score=208.97 TRINITY_DN3490_c0_g1_i3:45-3653(+)
MQSNPEASSHDAVHYTELQTRLIQAHQTLTRIHKILKIVDQETACNIRIIQSTISKFQDSKKTTALQCMEDDPEYSNQPPTSSKLPKPSLPSTPLRSPPQAQNPPIISFSPSPLHQGSPSCSSGSSDASGDDYSSYDSSSDSLSSTSQHPQDDHIFGSEFQNSRTKGKQVEQLHMRMKSSLKTSSSHRKKRVSFARDVTCHSYSPSKSIIRAAGHQKKHRSSRKKFYSGLAEYLITHRSSEATNIHSSEDQNQMKHASSDRHNETATPRLIQAFSGSTSAHNDAELVTSNRSISTELREDNAKAQVRIGGKGRSSNEKPTKENHSDSQTTTTISEHPRTPVPPATASTTTWEEAIKMDPLSSKQPHNQKNDLRDAVKRKDKTAFGSKAASSWTSGKESNSFQSTSSRNREERSEVVESEYTTGRDSQRQIPNGTSSDTPILHHVPETINVDGQAYAQAEDIQTLKHGIPAESNPELTSPQHSLPSNFEAMDAVNSKAHLTMNEILKDRLQRHSSTEASQVNSRHSSTSDDESFVHADLGILEDQQSFSIMSGNQRFPNQKMTTISKGVVFGDRDDEIEFDESNPQIHTPHTSKGFIDIDSQYSRHTSPEASPQNSPNITSGRQSQRSPETFTTLTSEDHPIRSQQKQDYPPTSESVDSFTHPTMILPTKSLLVTHRNELPEEHTSFNQHADAYPLSQLKASTFHSDRELGNSDSIMTESLSAQVPPEYNYDMSSAHFSKPVESRPAQTNKTSRPIIYDIDDDEDVIQDKGGLDNIDAQSDADSTSIVSLNHATIQEILRASERFKRKRPPQVDDVPIHRKPPHASNTNPEITYLNKGVYATSTKKHKAKESSPANAASVVPQQTTEIRHDVVTKPPPEAPIGQSQHPHQFIAPQERFSLHKSTKQPNQPNATSKKTSSIQTHIHQQKHDDIINSSLFKNIKLVSEAIVRNKVVGILLAGRASTIDDECIKTIVLDALEAIKKDSALQKEWRAIMGDSNHELRHRNIVRHLWLIAVSTVKAKQGLVRCFKEFVPKSGAQKPQTQTQSQTNPQTVTAPKQPSSRSGNKSPPPEKPKDAMKKQSKNIRKQDPTTNQTPISNKEIVPKPLPPRQTSPNSNPTPVLNDATPMPHHTYRHGYANVVYEMSLSESSLEHRRRQRQALDPHSNGDGTPRQTALDWLSDSISTPKLTQDCHGGSEFTTQWS